ncbi:MAG: ATP-binding protein [Acidimicrobiales bacterium]
MTDTYLTASRWFEAPAAPWEPRARVLVALPATPGGEAVIRQAARLAADARAELLGAHVRAGARRQGDDASHRATEILNAHRVLLEELGGTYREVVGRGVARCLVQVAKAESADQIVVGASRPSRFARMWNRALTERLVQQAGGSFDVHVVSRPTPEAPPSSPSRNWRAPTGLSPRRQAAACAVAATALPLLTLLLTSIRVQVGFSGALPSYLLVVTAVATVGGLLPAVPTVAAAFLLLNWFFVPPLHTFTIADVQSVSALVAYAVVAGVVSSLVGIAARRTSDAHRARAEAEALASMAGTLLRGDEALPVLVATLGSTFGARGVTLFRRHDGEWTVDAVSGPGAPKSPGSASLEMNLGGDARLAMDAPELTAEDRGVLNAFAAQLGLALESRRLGEEAARADAQSKANELRGALLAAISHDLRTPLASIKAAATSLLSEDVEWGPAASRELLSTIDSESDRLSALVANLLDMSRLRAGAVAVRSQPVPLEEVVSSALVGLPTAGRKVDVDVAETLPQVQVDPALLERVIANLIHNALQVSAEEQPVTVRADESRGRVELRVLDRGPGIAPADRERIFQPFQRLGDSPTGAGVGLGLAVARGFVEAMGCDLTVEDTPWGGASMVIRLPPARL